MTFIYCHIDLSIACNTDSFGYNDRSEVTAANIAGVASCYNYDEIGNLLLSAANVETNLYTANNLNQYTSILRDSVSPCEPSYDPDGNLLSDGVFAFTYDAANRLKTVSINGVLILTNFYDAKSRRVRKVTPEATTTFFYDDWNLIEERVAYTNGTTSTIHYYWGKDLSGTLQGAGGVGGLLYLTVDGTIYIPFYDNNGNITRYLDSSGTTVAQYSYDAFGNTISQSGPLAGFFRHRFSTKYFDAETGLYYYGYRFYHPFLMRWLNRDPLEEEGGLNLYAVCLNKPLIIYDLWGAATPSLDEVEKKYRDMVRAARTGGHDVAADNLEYFLNGAGGTRTISWTWLRDYGPVRTAEKRNRKRFEKVVETNARTLADGGRITIYDYFDATETANAFTELYYASGTFTVTSYGEFKLSRKGCKITITGDLDHRWWDPYDWHNGLDAYVPGFGRVKDSEALFLENNGRGRSFMMESWWTQSLKGTYSIRRYWWNGSSFDWSEPRGGNTGIFSRHGNTTSTAIGSGTGGSR